MLQEVHGRPGGVEQGVLRPLPPPGAQPLRRGGTGASVVDPAPRHSARAEWLEWWKGWLAERRLPPPECLGVRDLRRG